MSFFFIFHILLICHNFNWSLRLLIDKSIPVDLVWMVRELGIGAVALIVQANLRKWMRLRFCVEFHLRKNLCFGHVMVSYNVLRHHLAELSIFTKDLFLNALTQRVRVEVLEQSPCLVQLTLVVEVINVLLQDCVFIIFCSYIY